MINFLNKTYQELNDNIKFSEAKNAALITLNSALITACSSKVFDNNIAFSWRVMIACATLILFVPLLISVFSFVATTDSKCKAIRTINQMLLNLNKIDDEPKKYMFYSYISHYYSKKPLDYLNDINKNVFGDSNLKKEISTEYQLASQIVDLADVAYKKFVLFNISVIFEVGLLSVGGLVAIATIVVRLIAHM